MYKIHKVGRRKRKSSEGSERESGILLIISRQIVSYIDPEVFGTIYC